MQILTVDGTHTVFTNTAKGREEIAHRCHHLNDRQRLVLMVVEGIKKPEMLAPKIPMQELPEEISFLLHHGFIVSAARNALESKLERLKNPEILTPNSRGGFASAGIIFQPE